MDEAQRLKECLRHLESARSELLKAERLIQPTWGIDVREAVEVINEAINKCNFRLTFIKVLSEVTD